MKVSIIIPVLNESERLETAAARLRLTSRPRDVELVVVDGGSSDGTARVARRVADVQVKSPPGRAVQMHAGAKAAHGDLLLFLHADTRLPGGWTSLLRAAWEAEPRPGATAFRLAFDSTEPVYRLIAALGDRRSRWTGVPHGDQAIACRRDDYFRVGGFPAVALMEEYFLLPKLAALGPVVILDEAVATSTRRYERNGALRNALRNAALIGLFKLGVGPDRLARLYR